MVLWMKSRENITFMIAIIGFALSLYNFAVVLIERRKSIVFSICHAYEVQGRLLLIVDIVNKSQLPITLASGTIFIDGDTFKIGQKSTTWFTYADPIAKGRTGEKTEIFPIRIEGLGFFRGALEVSDCTAKTQNECIIELGSNRGKIRARVDMPKSFTSYRELLQYLK